MELNKEQIREILNKYVNLHGFPIKNIVVLQIQEGDCLSQYTFQGLLKILYEIE